MTTNESFERRLSDWLGETSEHRVPDHLGEVLLRTVATRQRFGWSSLERWLPVTTSLRARLTPARPALMLAVIALLVLVLAAAAILAAGFGPKEPINGYASNGRIFIVDGPSLFSVSATGADRHEELSLPAGATELAFSPDGTRLAFREIATTGRIHVLSLDRGTTVAIPMAGMVDIGGPIQWSPIGDRLAFVATDGTRDHLMVAAADGSATRSLNLGIDGDPDLWYPTWSPDATRLAIVAASSSSDVGAIYVTSLDGTGASEVQSRAVEIGGAGGTLAWSPDRGTELLLFVGQSRTVTTVDVGSGQQRSIAGGFWPTWSPQGDRVSYWDDGTKVVAALAGPASSTTVEVFPAFTGNCDEHPEMALKAFCGPARWSPDGMRLIATDITGSVVLSLLADGTGSPLTVDLTSPPEGRSGNVAWQPARS